MSRTALHRAPAAGPAALALVADLTAIARIEAALGTRAAAGRSRQAPAFARLWARLAGRR